jgi:guanylate kinase
MTASASASLYIIAAPSGAGKTSLVKALLESQSGITVSVSHTTRAPRPGEENGIDYHFIDIAGFNMLQAQGDFLESAQVFDNYYGTSKTVVEQNVGSGLDVILEIDWQGARQVSQIFPDAITIFILPPSQLALKERLSQRGQDDETTIARRMRDAVTEMSHYDEFQYLVINDDFDQALEDLRCIVQSQRLTILRQSRHHAAQIQELLA